mgnify:CR=1 FL=1
MAKKDYSNLTKEQLLDVIEKLEGKKKYGLVWDEERVPDGKGDCFGNLNGLVNTLEECEFCLLCSLC